MRKVIIPIISVLLLLIVPVFAENISIISVSGTDLVTGTINVGELEYATDMTVTVYDQNNVLNYIDIIPVSKEGYAEFSYHNLGKSGDYTFYFDISAFDIKMQYVLEDFIGNEYWNVFIGEMTQYAVNKQTQEFKLRFLEEIDDLGISLINYENIIEPEKVFDVMLNDFTGEYTSTDDIVRSFYKAVELCILKEQKDAQKYYNSEDTELSLFLPASCDNKEKCVLDEVSSKAKESVFTAVALEAVKFESSDNAVQSYLYHILFTVIKEAEHYSDVKKVMNSYAEAGLLSVSKNMSENIYKELMNNSYTTYNQLEEATDEAEKENKKTSSSSSSSSSSSFVSTGNNVVTPLNPIEPVEIKESVQSPKMTFVDMEDAKWALDAVELLVSENIISGTGDGYFEPHRNVTRAEISKMLTDLGGYEQLYSELPFQDVREDTWYYKYVGAVWSNGIVSGISEDLFAPDEAVTREQLATLVFRMIQNEIEFSQSDFIFEDDAQISNWASDAVYKLQSIGIIYGRTESEFCPVEPVTRVEAAVMLSRIVQYFDA